MFSNRGRKYQAYILFTKISQQGSFMSREIINMRVEAYSYQTSNIYNISNDVVRLCCFVCREFCAKKIYSNHLSNTCKSSDVCVIDAHVVTDSV